MVFIDIFGEFLNNHLGRLDQAFRKELILTFVLLTGLTLLPRLTLRLSLLSRPFLRGPRLNERGEMVRRGLDGDLERCRPLETSEYGDLVRGRPRGGDREGICVL
jgi:hypothetical protein